ncbi:putative MFS family arabinose efflux permease [Scopulibacillus darangshiensis]|uniref:Putative MFS family arabinose efflux permease n=1 Tax=Scopulibacillus darangshiensis TaxID=442528 RepID=A0A4R2NRS7_9BACL|nr:MFS transporter [Scopulibacillus darangshiensis]TCP24527.1 putative MFS family arabinose efflux permease [Scopulibacillus darangshiensis]
MRFSYHSFRFSILIGAVFISGASQGMLLPLISILLENSGTASALNGLNASALYIGVLIASPFIEKPTYKFGYKPMLIIGLALVMVSIFLFPVWESFWFWFALRLIVGIGDNMLHFAAQVWITVTSKPEKKGRNIAFYGLAFSLGFAIGPILARLLDFGLFFPFITAGSGCLIFWLCMWFLKNDYPEIYTTESGYDTGSLSRYKKVLILGWAGLVATFAYGFLEATLNGNFPVLALRNGYDIDAISALLPTFVLGGLITQIPLGMLSDKFGRKRVILIMSFLGTLSFIGASITFNYFHGLLLTFLIAGMVIGSIYSMGMTYVSDLLPNTLLSLGNILAGMSFSVGSMIGPLIGGWLIKSLPAGGFFYGIAAVMFAVFLSCLFHKGSVKAAQTNKV